MVPHRRLGLSESQLDGLLARVPFNTGPAATPRRRLRFPP